MNRKCSHSLLYIAALILACCSCKTRQASLEVNTDKRIEIRYEYIKTLDTIEVQIPYEVVKNTTRDTVSFLSTSVAYSCASIDANGMLHHTLENNHSELLPVVIEKTQQTHDSIVYIDSVRLETKIIAKEKELNGWHKFQIYGFWICLLLLVLLLAIRATKYLLKKIHS